MNEANNASDAYMIVGNLDFKDPSLKPLGESYRFLLVYDDSTTMEWEQLSWITSPMVVGFNCMQPLECGPSSKRVGVFRGLGRSSSSSSVLDGQDQSNGKWSNISVNSVGTLAKHGGGIPAWDGKTHTKMKLYIAEE